MTYPQIHIYTHTHIYIERKIFWFEQENICVISEFSYSEEAAIMKLANSSRIWCAGKQGLGQFIKIAAENPIKIERKIIEAELLQNWVCIKGKLK